jgi:hypothetical protein
MLLFVTVFCCCVLQQRELAAELVALETRTATAHALIGAETNTDHARVDSEFATATALLESAMVEIDEFIVVLQQQQQVNMLDTTFK